MILLDNTSLKVIIQGESIMRMTLQNLSFPKPEVCGIQEMYFRTGEDCIVSMNDSYCSAPRGKVISFDTYFNSFSIGKWNKYTKLDNLSLLIECEGVMLFHLYNAVVINGQLIKRVIRENRIGSDQRSETVIELPVDYTEGILYFTLTAESDNAVFYGGSYFTDIDEVELNDVNIAVDICTFRREKYVLRNIGILKKQIIENPESPLYGGLNLFISDNGQSLPAGEQTEQVHIFSNKNLGGAGGFGRGMIEIMKVREEYGITHILMMDDDVLIDPEAVLRTAVLLKMLKPEYTDAFIGGHMLKLNHMNVESEAADFFHRCTHTPVKSNYNLLKPISVVKNEIEDPINYLSWWYCCMPVDILGEDNLPIPVFIKRDDIEYGLRNGKTFIILNGINVWHEEFNYKSSSYLNYYYYRNLCIMISLHRKAVPAKAVWKFIENSIFEKIYTYRYKEAELILLGIQDFLKGVDWLKMQDGEALNTAIMKLGYKKVPIDTLEWEFEYRKFIKTAKYEETAGKKWIRSITQNGMFLAANKSIIVDAYKPSTELFYRVNRVLNYEDISKTGFITAKDYQSYYAIKKLNKEVRKQFLSQFDTVREEYSTRINELTNIAFWDKYLFEEGEHPEYKSTLPDVVLPPSTVKQRKTLDEASRKRLKQKVTSWHPVLKNRVMIAIHKREGLACNPKYILQELRALYGDKLEIYWVTDYPETCKEVRKLGAKILKSNSKEHYQAYQRTRVYITNDAFPEWAEHRRDQIWINTWHGALSYKHIGYEYLVPKSKAGKKIFELKNRQPDHYLSASRAFTEDTSKSFHFDPAVFMETGLPRNDVFFMDNEKLCAKVRKKYNIPKDKKIVLFAPTFRRGMKSRTYGLEFNKLRDALSARFGGDWVILFRNHGFVKDRQILGEDVYDVTSYPDMNEILCAADVLVSDYSSCMYDFCLQEKPCFVFAADLENYMKNDRSFAYPVEKWPFSIARSNEELEQVIQEFDEASYKEKLKAHFEDVGRYDDGNASRRAAELIGYYCGLEPERKM